MNAKTVNELLAKISNSRIDNIQYFYFTKNNISYLAKNRGSNNISIWQYTKNRKWKPLHNTDGFDKFKKIGKVFNSIKFDGYNETISFTDINDSAIDENIKTLTSNIKNSTLKIKWYFWVDNNDYFLFQNTNNEMKIWNYTLDRKWKPLHNADAFDGFKLAGKTLDSYNLSYSYRYGLSIGGIADNRISWFNHSCKQSVLLSNNVSLKLESYIKKSEIQNIILKDVKNNKVIYEGKETTIPVNIDSTGNYSYLAIIKSINGFKQTYTLKLTTVNKQRYLDDFGDYFDHNWIRRKGDYEYLSVPSWIIFAQLDGSFNSKIDCKLPKIKDNCKPDNENHGLSCIKR